MVIRILSLRGAWMWLFPGTQTQWEGVSITTNLSDSIIGGSGFSIASYLSIYSLNKIFHCS